MFIRHQQQGFCLSAKEIQFFPVNTADTGEQKQAGKAKYSSFQDVAVFLLRLRFLFLQPFLQCILQLLHGRIILIRIDGHAFFHDLINLLRSRTCGCGYPERYLPLPVFHPGIPLSADYPGSFP